MPNATLETYIETYRNDGVPEDVMRSNLNKMGWGDADINECLAHMPTPYPVHYAPISEIQPQETIPARVQTPVRVVQKQKFAQLVWIAIIAALIGAGIAYFFF